MTQIERVKSEIERLKRHSEESKNEFRDYGYNQNAFAEDCRITSFENLISFIESIQAESKVNLSNLNDAAGEYAVDHATYWEDDVEEGIKTDADALRDAFKEGANWIAGQGYTIEGEIKDTPTGGDDYEIYLDYDRNKMESILDHICDYVNEKYPNDEKRYKVTVQIRKA